LSLFESLRKGKIRLKKISIGTRIPLFYLIFSSLWILLSDRFLASIIQDPEKLTEFQSYKGWAFVTASAMFIYYLLKQYLDYQHQAEAKVRDSEERLRLALTAANQGVFDLNILNGNLIVNDIYASILGYDHSSFSETIPSWLEKIYPDDREQIEKLFMDYIHGDAAEYDVEYRLRTQSQEWIWIHSRGSIVEYSQDGHPLRLSGIITDITEKKNYLLRITRLLIESERRLHRIEVLHEIESAISTNHELETTLITLITHIMNQLEVDAVGILLQNKNKQEFTYAASKGFRSNQIEKIKVKLEESLAGRVSLTDTFIHMNESEIYSSNPSLDKLLKEEGFQNYFGIPIKAKGNFKGILELYHRSPVDPDQEWLSYFETLGGQAAVALENAQLFESLNQANDDLLQANNDLVEAYDATIESLSKAIDLRDTETEGHSLRVMELSINFAKKLDFSEEEIVQIRRGALLHDIGKLGVADSILNKVGLLDPEERIKMQEHPTFAYKMLRTIKYLQNAIDIPHLHHEKWDGTGYPNGLKGEEIPFVARMFAIVDVFEALTSDRSYRKAWSRQKAIDYIREESGRHFDPAIVPKFLEFIEEII
jgi:putative nucleotidyltransferase with HDIG domain/PAS domain S-box-containing protein